jgi:hypothetical protein
MELYNLSPFFYKYLPDLSHDAAPGVSTPACVGGDPGISPGDRSNSRDHNSKYCPILPKI